MCSSWGLKRLGSWTAVKYLTNANSPYLEVKWRKIEQVCFNDLEALPVFLLFSVLCTSWCYYRLFRSTHYAIILRSLKSLLPHTVFHHSDACCKIMHPKYSKHQTYLLASTMGCSFVLNHGLKAGLSEEKMSLMPCLRTLSNVFFKCILF